MPAGGVTSAASARGTQRARPAAASSASSGGFPWRLPAGSQSESCPMVMVLPPLDVGSSEASGAAPTRKIGSGLPRQETLVGRLGVEESRDVLLGAADMGARELRRPRALARADGRHDRGMLLARGRPFVEPQQLEPDEVLAA